jgi:hypothetical protein
MLLHQCQFSVQFIKVRKKMPGNLVIGFITSHTHETSPVQSEQTAQGSFA